MTNTSAGTTITALHDMFSSHGLPEILVSDNGSQFNSRDVRRFVHTVEFYIVFQQRTNHPLIVRLYVLSNILKSAIKQAQLTRIDA